MTFETTQYTKANASEMMPNYAAIRAKLMGPVKPRTLALVSPQSIAPREPEIAAGAHSTGRRGPKPTWMRQPVVFDEHVIAFRVAKRVIDMKAKGEIDELDPEKRSIRQIVTEILLQHPTLTIPMLKGVERRKEVCIVRQTAMYEIRKQRPDMSLPMIGRWFGGRDHTTVLHAIKKIAALRGEA